jgi:hypothetical protein
VISSRQCELAFCPAQVFKTIAFPICEIGLSGGFCHWPPILVDTGSYAAIAICSFWFRQRLAPSTLSDDAQAIEAPVLMQVAHSHRMLIQAHRIIIGGCP